MNDNMSEEYLKMKRTHTMILIIGIILGLIIFILGQSDNIVKKKKANIVSDVSDIYVK